MANDKIDIIGKISEPAVYAGFAAFAHYLYTYQKGRIAFKFSLLVIAVILGAFIGFIIDNIVPNDFIYEVWMIKFNKTSIAGMAGFGYKIVLDIFDKYQNHAIDFILKTGHAKTTNKKK